MTSRCASRGTRVSKNDSIYSMGVDGVSLDYHRVSTLRFSSHGCPLSCSIYDKTLEIKQKSGKTWFHDLWRKGVDGLNGGTWDGKSDVWRVEFRFRREFLRNLKTPIEDAYDLLNHFQPLWEYAAGCIAGGDDTFRRHPTNEERCMQIAPSTYGV